MKKLGLVLIIFLSAFNVHADESSKVVIDTKNLYLGGGLGLNSLSGIELSDGLGYQLFAGYDLPVKVGEGVLSVEIGYMDSGSVDTNVTGAGKVKAKGIWSTAVISLPLKGKLSLLGRAGLDFGDDDGFMFGAGLGFELKEKIDLRAEYVVRDNIDSLQFNVVIQM